MSINREEKAGVFTDDEIVTMAVLLPHVKRALAISQMMDFTASWRIAWDRMMVGMISTDDRGRVDDLNVAAQNILDAHDGVSLGNRELVFESQI